MNRIQRNVLVMMIACLVGLPTVLHAGKHRDRVRYEPYYHDPVLKEMKQEIDSLQSERDSVTTQIKSTWKKRKDDEEENRKVIRFDFSHVAKPESPGTFNAPFHFPPIPQYYTGTCWSFSTTSLLESEIKRIYGKEIKLSEMFTVYWEFVEKARGYVRKRGNQVFAQGSESDAVIIIMKQYGAVPTSVYSGLVGEHERHSHREMETEMRDYLTFIDDHGYWDEDAVITQVRGILDRYLGRPPERFDYEGAIVTPMQFVRDVVQLDLDDYVQVMSTLSEPFYRQGEFKVEDNWRPTGTYYNVPLEDFMECINRATGMGYTVCIGGDVSEPGYNGLEDAAIVPTFDIPQEYIDQDSRELRFFNRTTADDHGVHLLARKQVGGRDWYLIKDSSRSARHGTHEGYYFYRDDYIKLKMLTYMVHRDAIRHLTRKFEQARTEPGSEG